MKRNLKALGLALAAVFAFSAVAASTASAQTAGVLTSDGPVTLTGTEVATGLNGLTAFGSEVTCPGSTYGGHKLNSKSLLASGEGSVTITPKYINCNSAGSPRSVAMNGCDYVFDDFTTTPVDNKNGTYGFTVDIVCPANSQIEVTGGPCTVKVPAQTGLLGFHATNQTGGHVLLSGTATGITATCSFLHTSTASQHQEVTVGGHNSLGGATAISISH
jgi:hypothetical protein